MTTLRFTGRGYGHGVGMCVIGAGRRATRGETVRAILAQYYPGTRAHAAVGGDDTADALTGRATPQRRRRRSRRRHSARCVVAPRRRHHRRGAAYIAGSRIRSRTNGG